MPQPPPPPHEWAWEPHPDADEDVAKDDISLLTSFDPQDGHAVSL